MLRQKTGSLSNHKPSTEKKILNSTQKMKVKADYNIIIKGDRKVAIKMESRELKAQWRVLVTVLFNQETKESLSKESTGSNSRCVRLKACWSQSPTESSWELELAESHLKRRLSDLNNSTKEVTSLMQLALRGSHMVL